MTLPLGRVYACAASRSHPPTSHFGLTPPSCPTGISTPAPGATGRLLRLRYEGPPAAHPYPAPPVPGARQLRGLLGSSAAVLYIHWYIYLPSSPLFLFMVSSVV